MIEGEPALLSFFRKVCRQRFVYSFPFSKYLQAFWFLILNAFFQEIHSIVTDIMRKIHINLRKLIMEYEIVVFVILYLPSFRMSNPIPAQLPSVPDAVRRKVNFFIDFIKCYTLTM